jgi:type IV fimbrial biogenesis protein FimT
MRGASAVCDHMPIQLDSRQKEIDVTSRRKMKGFTLFELMVTLAVAAIILSFGVPGFMSFIQNNRAATHTNDLITALNLARSEATRRSATVTVCSSDDGATCSDSNDWSTGWIILNAADEVLRTWPERSGGANVITGDAQVQFQARGSLAGGAAPLLRVRLPDCTGDQGRDVAVNAAGRISTNRVDC